MRRILQPLLWAAGARAVFDGDDLDGSLSFEVDGASFCQRWFHQGGGDGCSAPRDGAQGVLYATQHFDSSAELLAEAGDEPIVLLMLPEEIQGVAGTTAMAQFDGSGQLEGVIVLDSGNTPADGWSPTAQSVLGEGTPFVEMDLDSDISWNPWGNAINMQHLGFAMAAVDDVDMQERLLELAKGNVDGPAGGVRYSAKIDAYMGQDDVTAAECLTWKDINGDTVPKCQPIGGQSIKASFGNYQGITGSVLGAVAIDMSSLFQEEAYSALGTAAHLTAFLAAADALGAADDELAALDQQINMVAFQGEAYGYLGSHRLVWDNARPCDVLVDAADSPWGREFCADPLYESTMFINETLSDFSMVIGLDQVGATEDGDLWVHVHDEKDDPVSAVIVDDVPKDDLLVGVSSAGFVNSGLPPTPATFLKSKNENVPTAVITGYNLDFVNEFFGSRFDTPDRVNVSVVGEAATLFARSLFMAAGGSSDAAADIAANATLVDQLFDCLTSSWACDELMRPYIEQEIANQEAYLGASVSIRVQSPPSFYASVYSYSETRQPVIWRGDGSTVAAVLETATPFDKDSDKFVLVPNALEIFVRSFLADKTALDAQGERFGACETSEDCDKAAAQECAYGGQCVLKNAFYHNAFTPGIRPTETPGIFEPEDLDAPMAAEPNWDELKITILPTTSSSVAYTALGFGIAVAAGMGVGAWKMAGVLL